MLNKTFAIAVLAGLSITGAAQARDQIHIVGSSTVYPFATAVAEQFGRTGSFKTPVVESTGTGGGLKLFCQGVADTTPDIANASRRIKKSELELCEKNGVSGVTEIIVGYDGIVVANAKAGPTFALTRAQLFKAIAATVPQGGKLVPNPYKKWSDVDPSLPGEKITVFGPASNHGTRDALVELVMDQACKSFPEIQKLDESAKKVACGALREDGAYIELSEDYSLTLMKLKTQPSAVGILTFGYLDQNADSIKGASIDGGTATYENIATGDYPLSRPLYIYVKKDHVGKIPGIEAFLAEMTSEKASGPDGYLSEKGLIASPDAVREEQRLKAKELVELKL